MESTTSGIIRLSFQSKQTVVVDPENQDRFLTTASAAAQACQQAQQLTEWVEQYKQFLGFLHQWCKDHADKVRSCYVTIGDHSLNVLVLLNGDDYDFDLDDQLAELDLALFNQYPVCTADVIQIPNQNALTEQFLSRKGPSEAVQVYGDGAGPSNTGAA